MRNCPPETIQAAVAEAFEAAGGLRKVSSIVHLSISALSETTEFGENAKRKHGLGVNYLHTLAEARPAAAAVLARHFAALAGGVFQPVEVSGNVVNLVEQSGVVAKETGEAVSATIRAASHLAGGHVSGKDCVEAEREIDEAVASLLRAKAGLRAQRGAA